METCTLVHTLFWWCQSWNLTLSITISMDYGCNCSRLLKHIIAQTHTQCLASVCDTELKDHLSELTQCACVCVNETDYSLSHERKLAYPYEEQMRKTRTHTSKHHRIKSAKWTSSVPSLKEAPFRTFYSILLWFCCPFTSYTTRDDSHTHTFIFYDT